MMPRPPSDSTCPSVQAPDDPRGQNGLAMLNEEVPVMPATSASSVSASVRWPSSSPVLDGRTCDGLATPASRTMPTSPSTTVRPPGCPRMAGAVGGGGGRGRSPILSLADGFVGVPRSRSSGSWPSP
jgi:hypothetical protein